MSTPPQPDPYKVLGLPKDTDSKSVKKAYMKLVLTCHPDKVKDKQDEFQKVQEAYETLIDDTKRAAYDDLQLRRETGKAGPAGGPSVFDFEVRTAEPRSSTFRSSPKTPSGFYAQPANGSYDDDLRPRSFDEAPRARARKTASYEERKRPSTRDGERSRRSEEEREHERWTKEATRSRQEASKKMRERERRKGGDDKYYRAHVEEDEVDEPYQARTRAVAEDFRDKLRGKIRSKEDPLIIRTNKMDALGSYAADYIHASYRKARPDYEARPKAVGRAETYQEQPAYNVRHVDPPSPYLEEDSPRRSSAARSSSRRGSDQLPIRTRDQPRSSLERERKGSYEQDRFVNIVEAAPQAPPAPSIKKPTLQSYTSAPPLVPNHSSSRKEPSRSQTLQPEYARRDAGAVPPPLPRASTFQTFDKVKSASRGGGGSGSSKLKKSYVSEESDPEDYGSRRNSPRREHVEPKRYIYDESQSRTIPIQRYRDLRREESHGSPRERSVSPRGGSRRPALRATSSSAGPHSYSRGGSHYFSSQASPEPIIKEAGRPRMAGRGSSSHSSGGLFGEVKRSDSKFTSYPVRA